MAITLEVEKRYPEPRRETLHKVYNLLFDEKLKAWMLVLLQLHRKEGCAWNEIYEGSGLRDMGVSTSTVSRILRELEEQGIIVREKAPSPIKVRYRLIRRFNELDSLVHFENMLKEAGEEDMENLIKFALHESTSAIFWMISDALKKGDPREAVIHCFTLIHSLLLLAVNTPETKTS